MENDPDVDSDKGEGNAGLAILRREAGGYPPPTRLLELFLDTPPWQQTKTGRH
jgi:hypothetical protein